MSVSDPTFIGQVASVSGGIVRVRMRDDMTSTLVMIDGESYRVGQIGAFVRIPLGYTNLYAVCTQVGADAAPRLQENQTGALELDEVSAQRLSGYRWLGVVLFGEALGRSFDRGVSQYPTVGDEVHVVTHDDLGLIYRTDEPRSVAVGGIAAASGIPAYLGVAGLVSRHCAIVGSTGSGKSNLVTVLVDALAGKYPASRILLIDPHGEYASALGAKAKVLKLSPDVSRGEQQLRVPFWALSFAELQEMLLGGLQPPTEAAIRDIVLDMKTVAAARLANPPPAEALTADSPVPFSVRRLWFELDDFERRTYRESQNQTTGTLESRTTTGDAEALRPNAYPAPTSQNTPPFPNRLKRNISRQLELMRSRLRDARFAFLFDPGEGLSPDSDGRVSRDIDSVVRDWVGHERPVTVLDVSGIPSDILSLIVGSMVRIIYDTVFWGAELSVGGREQPLLIVLEEAHRFVPEGEESPAHRTLAVIAKEGRKYGVGLVLVTQRPSEVDTTILSQCGTMIALRMANSVDRSKVAAAFPDDLGGLAALLPALRTGEGLFMGEALKIPSRVRILKAGQRPIGDDPKLPDAWQRTERPDGVLYARAVANWRASRKLASP